VGLIVSFGYRSKGSLRILGSCDGEVTRVGAEALGNGDSIGFLKTISTDALKGRFPLMTFA
jgi:hypothetical protein